MEKLIQFIKRRKVALLIITLLIGGGVYYLSRDKEAPVYETVIVRKGDVVQEVSVIGHVSSSNEVDLSFERGGRVVTDPVEVGVYVKKGDTLVRLDASELLSLRAQAKANLNYEVAKLAELKEGTRPEDIAISKAKLESAEIASSDARKSVFDKLHVAYTIADDAIHNKTDHFYTNPRTSHPKITIPIADEKLIGILESERVLIEDVLIKWKDRADNWNEDTDLFTAVDDIESAQNDIKMYLDYLALAVNSIVSSTMTTQTTIDGWKLDVSTARTNINTSISSVLGVEQAYRSAFQAQKIAANELRLKEAGATKEAVTAQESRIAAMKAALDNYDAQIAKTKIIAPFSGVVIKQNAKIGQTITPNVTLVSLMSDDKFKIEANIPEVDVAKIKIGDKARVTLDAYGPDIFFATEVATIDPAETIIEGVSTYKVTLLFVEPDDRIRSGMTANIDVSTDKRENVLVLPSRAITTRDGKKFVRVLKGGEAQEVEIELGLRGSDGNVEVTRGLFVGDSVITFEKK